jgi:hypothetical protein
LVPPLDNARLAEAAGEAELSRRLSPPGAEVLVQVRLERMRLVQLVLPAAGPVQLTQRTALPVAWVQRAVQRRPVCGMQNSVVLAVAVPLPLQLRTMVEALCLVVQRAAPGAATQTLRLLHSHLLEVAQVN